MDTCLASLMSKSGGLACAHRLTSPLVAAVGAAAVVALVLLQLDQLLLVLVGIALSFLLQRPSDAPQRRARKFSAASPERARKSSVALERGRRPFAAAAEAPCSFVAVESAAAARRELRATPAPPPPLPIRRPALTSRDFAGQVDELVVQITPGPASERLVERLRAHVAAVIAPVFPGADVVAVLSGDISSRTAFGQAEPEVNIVTSVDPLALRAWLGECSGFSAREPPQARNERKAALQGCLTPLIRHGGFRFRRLVTASKSQEPRATLIAPPSVHGGGGDNVAVCFSVNSGTPLRHAALVAECTRIFWQAKALMLFVKHWARNRSLCHTNALSPYAWALLVAHFLQVGRPSASRSLLPPLRGALTADGRPTWLRGSSFAPRPCDDVDIRVAELFSDLLDFYSGFAWSQEVVSVRRGARAAAVAAPPDDDLHVPTSVGLPNIEDPFEPGRNVAENMKKALVAHLHVELARARALLSSGASLEVLTQPWEPSGADGEGWDERPS